MGCLSLHCNYFQGIDEYLRGETSGLKPGMYSESDIKSAQDLGRGLLADKPLALRKELIQQEVRQPLYPPHPLPYVTSLQGVGPTP